MSKSEKLFRLKIAIEQISMVHSALCRERYDEKIRDELFEIIVKTLLLEDKLKKGGAE